MTKDTLRPLVDIINESERANEVMDPKTALLQSGKQQKNLP